MEHEERIRLLLHPEQYSDEQLQQMLADDPELTELLDELALTKQAFVKRETDEEAIPVEAEWEKFYAKHSAEIDASDDVKPRVALIRRLTGYMPYKLAASFIGVLFTVGVAFAAVRIAHYISNGQTRTIADSVSVRVSPLQKTEQAVAPADTATARPIVFDNMPLEEMLPKIAAYYHKKVEFANGDARQLRFYFVWKQEEGLEVTLHRLNLFESVNIEQKDNKIIVE